VLLFKGWDTIKEVWDRYRK